MALPLPLREHQTSQDLGQDEERDEPAPDQQLEIDIVPYSHEGEDEKEVQHRSCLAPVAARARPATAAEGNVYVANDPPVEASMPTPPEGQGGVVVGHAADHVLRWIHTVE